MLLIFHQDSGEPNSGILFFMITAVEILSKSHSKTKCLSVKENRLKCLQVCFNYFNPVY